MKIDFPSRIKSKLTAIIRDKSFYVFASKYKYLMDDLSCKWIRFKPEALLLSQGILGLCCSIETRDHIERITLTAVLFD